MSEELLPRPQSPMVDRAGNPTPEWYDFLRNLTTGGGSDNSTAVATLQQQMVSVLSQIQTLGLTALGSLQMYDTLMDGASIKLKGDEDAPAPNRYYGTASGDRGFHALTLALPPILIPEGETYTVPENRQAVVALPITVDGALEIDGALVEV